MINKFVLLCRKGRKTSEEQTTESAPVELIEPSIDLPESPLEPGDEQGVGGPHLVVPDATVDFPDKDSGRDSDESDGDSDVQTFDVPKVPALIGPRDSRELAPVETDEESPPTFTTFVNSRLWRREQKTLSYAGEITKLYRDVFTPTRPKRSYKEFTGRNHLIQSIVQAVEEERAHVVLCGDKGLGKTSLANVVAEFADEAGYLVARVTSTADLTFERFVHAILDQLSDRITDAPAGDILKEELGATHLADLLNGGTFDVPAALKALERLTGHQVLVLIDDYDRVQHDGFKVKMTELMRALSDHGAWLSLIILGRGKNPGELLLDDFESVAGIVGMKLSPLEDGESEEAVKRGGLRLGIQFNGDVTESLVRLSQGIPSVLQWLCLLTIRRALRRYSDEVEMEDLTEIVEEAAGKIDSTLSAQLDRICCGSSTAWISDILFLAAQTPNQGDGVFSTLDMSDLSHSAVGKQLSELSLHWALTRLCAVERDTVLEKLSTTDGTRYRFVNPTMRAIVMLNNATRVAAVQRGALEQSNVADALPSPGAA
jgi:hypothetical protein